MKKRILIVDDEPNVRLNYRVTLETEGFEVIEAANGVSALAALGESAVDMAILDMRMADMDGLQLLDRMRKAGFQIPVIFITAYGDIPHAVRAIRLGAIDFLEKPLLPQALRFIVWEVLARHASDFRRPEEDAQFSIHLQQAKRLINLRDFKTAREHIAKALELREDSAEIFNLAGVLFEMLEDYDRAKRYYGHAMRLSKNYEPAQQNMRRIYELFQFGSSSEPVHLGKGTP